VCKYPFLLTNNIPYLLKAFSEIYQFFVNAIIFVNYARDIGNSGVLKRSIAYGVVKMFKKLKSDPDLRIKDPLTPAVDGI